MLFFHFFFFFFMFIGFLCTFVYCLFIRIRATHLYINILSKHFSNWPISKISFVLVSSKSISLSLSRTRSLYFARSRLCCLCFAFPSECKRKRIRIITTTTTTITSNPWWFREKISIVGSTRWIGFKLELEMPVIRFWYIENGWMCRLPRVVAVALWHCVNFCELLTCEYLQKTLTEHILHRTRWLCMPVHSILNTFLFSFVRLFVRYITVKSSRK